MKSSNLFGDFHVTPTLTAMHEAAALFPRYRHYQELRQHALKLAFWPKGGSLPSGQVCDLNWDTVTGMPEPRAYELRIDDVIGGFNNLRVIFYVFRKDIVLPGDMLPRLWTIGVMQKKTRRFSARDLRIFRSRVTIVRRRNYAEFLN